MVEIGKILCEEFRQYLPLFFQTSIWILKYLFSKVGSGFCYGQTETVANNFQTLSLNKLSSK